MRSMDFVSLTAPSYCSFSYPSWCLCETPYRLIVDFSFFLPPSLARDLSRAEWRSTSLIETETSGSCWICSYFLNLTSCLFFFSTFFHSLYSTLLYAFRYIYMYASPLLSHSLLFESRAVSYSGNGQGVQWMGSSGAGILFYFESLLIRGFGIQWSSLDEFFVFAFSLRCIDLGLRLDFVS